MADYPQYRVDGTDGFNTVGVEIHVWGDAAVDPQDIVDAVEAAVDGTTGITLTSSYKLEIVNTPL